MIKLKSEKLTPFLDNKKSSLNNLRSLKRLFDSKERDEKEGENSDD